MTMPEMKPVESKSGNVKAIGYDEEASKLYVEFASGAQYSYANVPPEIWTELQAAHSKGSYIHAKLRGQYPTDRLDSKPASA